MESKELGELSGQKLRAQRTDQLVRRAALELLAEEGFSALAFTRISERAGVSRRPVHDRYDNRIDIAIDLWQNIAVDYLAAQLRELIDAYESEARAADRFVSVMQGFLSPTEELLSAIEILVISQFDARLRELISKSAIEVFDPLVAHDGSDAAIRKATKRAYATSFALGMLLVARLPSADVIDISPHSKRLYESLLLDAEIIELPHFEGRLFNNVAGFNTGDNALEGLLQAALDEVTEVGFDGATTVRIARRSGSSEGYLFSKYDSKLDLFIDAVKRKTAITLTANNDKLAEIAGEYGQPAADALMIKESMRPESPGRRAIALERLRIAMHNPEMRRVQAESLETFVRSVQAENAEWAEKMTLSRARFSFAVGAGVSAVPLLMPSAWNLPFNATTRAFFDLENL